MPGVDPRHLQFFPRKFERAASSFRSEAAAPAALHEMEPHFEIRLAECIDPGPKPAAAAEIAIAVIEQRPILNTTGSLSLDFGVKLLADLGFGEFTARINERRDGGIAPQLPSGCHSGPSVKIKPVARRSGSVVSSTSGKSLAVGIADLLNWRS